MRKKKSTYPSYWNDVRRDDGSRLGSWALHDGMLWVMNPEGITKKVRPSAGTQEGLARLVLGERFP